MPWILAKANYLGCILEQPSNWEHIYGALKCCLGSNKKAFVDAQENG